jgi:DNA-binding CsgD family transcriptional regulator
MGPGRPRHKDILTPREWDVLHLIAEGLTNEQIGERLGISLSAVKYHVGEILSKLEVSSRHEAAQLIQQRRDLSGFMPLIWLRSVLATRPLATTLVTTTAIVAVALVLTTPWSRDMRDEPPPVLIATPGPDLAQVDHHAFEAARLASPYPHTVLLTKTNPQEVGEAAPILALLARVASLSELQSVLSDDIYVIVVDRSAVDEVTGSDFLTRELTGGRAVMELNVCLDEVHFLGYGEPIPRATGIVTEISPSGEKREIEVIGDEPVQTSCDLPFAQQSGVFNYRRVKTLDLLELPHPDENEYDATGGARFEVFERVLTKLDAAAPCVHSDDSPC